MHGILDRPWGIAIDPAGDLFIADRDHQAVRAIDTNGLLTTVAGTGRAGYNGDGQKASVAQLSRPVAVAFDAAGALYITDENNYRIRKVGSAGMISTVAGNGHYGCGGDGGPAVNASLKNPGDIVFAPDGSMLISDGECFRIRRVAPDGTISTFAGNGKPGCGGVGARCRNCGSGATSRCDTDPTASCISWTATGSSAWTPPGSRICCDRTEAAPAGLKKIGCARPSTAPATA